MPKAKKVEEFLANTEKSLQQNVTQPQKKENKSKVSNLSVLTTIDE